MVGSQGSITCSFHHHNRRRGSGDIRQHWRRRRSRVSKQQLGFKHSYPTPSASRGLKAVVVREPLHGSISQEKMWVAGKTGCSFYGAMLTQRLHLMPQPGAGRLTGVSPQCTVKERMKLSRFGVLSISSPHGQKIGPTPLHLKLPTFSSAHQTQPKGRSPREQS